MSSGDVNKSSVKLLFDWIQKREELTTQSPRKRWRGDITVENCIPLKLLKTTYCTKQVGVDASGKNRGLLRVEQRNITSCVTVDLRVRHFGDLL